MSSNAVQGSLGDVTVGRLLDVCRDQLLTGRVDIHCRRGRGHVELRAGVVHQAVFCGHRDDAAVERMRELGEGRYTITQRLPGLDGSLGSAASFRGEVTDLSLVELMRHCEQNALTCNVTIIHEFDRAQIVYRAGEIAEVSYNGVPDEDKIVDLVRLRDGRFLVSAPPLEIGVRAKPVVRRAPTEPFRIEHLAQRPPDGAPAVGPGGELDWPRWPEPEPEPEPQAGRGGRLRGRLIGALRAAAVWLESGGPEELAERLRARLSLRRR